MPNEPQTTIPQGGSPDTYDARLSKLEAWQDTAETKLDEIHAAVVGGKGGKEAGFAEELRAVREQVRFLYGLLKWGAGAATTAILAIWATWLASLKH